MPPRDEAIIDGGSCIVEYERWLESGDQQILDEIEEYNQDDFESTWRLPRLARGAPGRLRRSSSAPAGAPEPRDAEPGRRAFAEPGLGERALSRRPLARRRHGARCGRPRPTGRAVLLGDLLQWHRREDQARVVGSTSTASATATRTTLSRTPRRSAGSSTGTAGHA